MANVHTRPKTTPTGSDNQGKGSWQRPSQVSDAEYAANWERIFGKKETKGEDADGEAGQGPARP